MSVNVPSSKGIVLAATNVYTQATASASGTAYVQLVASTSSAIYVTHVTRTPAWNADSGSLDVILATGAAASEVIAFTGSANGGFTSTAGSTTVYTLPFPIRVPSSTRVAAKLSGTSTNASTVGIVYVAESAVL